MSPQRGKRESIVRTFCAAALLLAFGAGGAQAGLPDENGYFSLLRGKFESARDNYAKALPEELILFRGLFPKAEKIDSVEYLLAVLYDQNGQEPAALANFLKIVYLYPASPTIPVTVAHLRRIASGEKKGIASLFNDENLSLLKRQVLKLTGDKLPAGGGERGYLDFIQLLADSRVESLAPYLAAECEHYLFRLGYNLDADRVMILRGDTFRLQREWHRAILSYGEAPLVSPYGKYLPEALLKSGEVYFRDLSDYRMTRTGYQAVIDKYPAAPEAAHASVLLAEVDAAEKNFGQALIRLEDTARRFPLAEIRVECYSRIAGIYADHLGAPQKALEFEKRIVDDYPTDPKAAQALVRIGDIEEGNRNYAAAVASYRRLAEMFHDNPITPDYLLKAAEIAGKKMKDSATAQAIYQQLAKEYPQTDAGRKAARRVG